MPKSAAIYCRISSDPKETGLGVARQEELCRKVAEGKGWTVAAVYIDNDESAWKRKRKRPEWNRMLADIEAKRVDAVVVFEVDRLARQPRDLETFFEVCDAAGVKAMATVSGDIDLGTSNGQFTARMLGAIAKKESDVRSERLQAKHDQLRASGLNGGGGRSLGFINDPARPGYLQLVPAEAKLIKEAAKRIIGGESVWSVVSDWNRRGIKTPQGNPWRTWVLCNSLRSPRLAGLRQRADGSLGTAVWRPVLDRAVWERLRKALDRRQTHNAGFKARKFVLSGFLRCGRCGRSMVSGRRSGKRGSVRAYRCASTADGKGCGLQMNADAVEAFAISRAFSLLPYMPSGGEPVSEVGDVAVTALYAELDQDRAALTELESDYRVERVIDRATYFQMKERIEAQIKERQALVAELTGGPQAGSWAALIAASKEPLPADRLYEDRSQFDDVRALIGACFERIMVRPADPRKPRAKPDVDRIEVEFTPAGMDAERLWIEETYGDIEAATVGA
jgi:site-specific DNA recombinase